MSSNNFIRRVGRRNLSRVRRVGRRLGRRLSWIQGEDVDEGEDEGVVALGSFCWVRARARARAIVRMTA